MFPKFIRPTLALLTLIWALSVAATPAQAASFVHGEKEQPRAQQAQKERGTLFSWLARLFGKSGGGMDPNGIGPQD